MVTTQDEKGKIIAKLKDLSNWSRNPRSIKGKDFDRLKKEIEDLGIYKPQLILEDGTVIGGNMRLRAYKELGRNEVPVTILTFQKHNNKFWAFIDGIRDGKKEFISIEEGILSYALSDNDRAGFYDEDLLANMIPEYPDFEWDDYAVDLKEPQSLQDLIDSLTPTEEDEVPEVSEGEPDSKLGEVYQLGRHKLMCGDATKIEDVEKLTDGVLTDLVLTDPPYNTGMTEKSQSEPNKRFGQKAGSTWLSHMFADALTPAEWQILINESLANMEAVTKGQCAFYVFIDWRNVGRLKEEMEQSLTINNIIVWDKVVHGLGSDYKFTYEMCIVGKKGKPEIHNRIGTDYQDIWRVQRQIGRNEDHATAKPIGLIKKPILHASKEDDIVLDLFGGSGSTLIACEQTNRICYMMELSPAYCDVIRKRYEDFTNSKKGVE